MNSETEQLTGLRNERKPCHFWVDNEVADCYQPIVGADAIWVYCRIARNAHGAWIVSPKVRGGDTRVSLREMAEWCGKSVDTVWRCLQVLVHVGLLQAERGTKSKGRYALADVKDLVTREGATYDREMGSFQLPEKRSMELTQQVRELRLKLARKGSEVAGPAVADLISSVAQSDSLNGSLFSVPDGKCDRSVALSDKSVAPAVQHPLLETARQQEQTTTPKSPQAGTCVREEHDPPFDAEQLAHLATHPDDPHFQAKWRSYYSETNRTSARAAAIVAETERVEAARVERLKGELGDVESARTWVMRCCGFVERNRRRGIGLVIEAVLRRRLDDGDVLWKTAPAMVEAYARYVENGEFIKPRYGPVKFFELGIWDDEHKWHWDRQKLQLANGARLGSGR